MVAPPLITVPAPTCTPGATSARGWTAVGSSKPIERTTLPSSRRAALLPKPMMMRSIPCSRSRSSWSRPPSTGASRTSSRHARDARHRGSRRARARDADARYRQRPFRDRRRPRLRPWVAYQDIYVLPVAVVHDWHVHELARREGERHEHIRIGLAELTGVTDRTWRLTRVRGYSLVRTRPS